MEKVEIDERIDEMNDMLNEAARQDMAPLRVYRAFPEKWSENRGNIAGALAKAQGACKNAKKDKAGYNYNYATLDNLTDIIRKPMSDNELAVIQSHELIKGDNPSVVTHTTLVHSSGEWHTSSIELPIKEMSQLTPAQMIGVNCTYGRRYALQAMFLIAGEEDTDGTIR